MSVPSPLLLRSVPLVSTDMKTGQKVVAIVLQIYNNDCIGEKVATVLQ